MGVGTSEERELVDLLGGSRAAIARILKREGERSAPELAEDLDISDVAVRRHLTVLAEDGLITDRTVKQERGRPVARYRLTARGEELFPHRYDEMVDELIDFLGEEHGRDGVRAFLRWRQARTTDRYAAEIDAEDTGERLEQLAEALRCAGYEATVDETEDGYELTQTHCAIYEVAREHPEMCAYEAAVFRDVLGDDLHISRRETLAKGDEACVCTVRPAADGLPITSAAPSD